MTTTRRTSAGFSVADLPVNTKILSAVGTASVVAVAVGVTGLLALGRASESAQRIYASNVSNVGAVGDIKAAFLQGRVDVTLHAASTGSAAKSKLRDAFTADSETVTTGSPDTAGAIRPVIPPSSTTWPTSGSSSPPS